MMIEVSVDSQPLKMKLVFVGFLLFLDSYLAIFKAPQDADSENSSFRIYRGTAMMQFPYAVKVFGRENQETLSGYSCSGSIIHHSWIVTAAHCLQESLKVFDIFIGNVTNDANHVVRATQVFIHPNYTLEPELLNDFALIKLKRSLETLNTTFEILSLPQIKDFGRSLVGLQGIVAGYGKVGNSGSTSVTPNWARYEIISLGECRNIFLRNFTEYAKNVICCRGLRASTCQGDSGEALVITRKGKKKLIGIVSNGFESCETVGEPEIFTRVDGYLDFIQEIIKNN